MSVIKDLQLNGCKFFILNSEAADVTSTDIIIH